jgi:hypothetical protein
VSRALWSDRHNDVASAQANAPNKFRVSRHRGAGRDPFSLGDRNEDRKG